jgi:hypothetical protein
MFVHRLVRSDVRSVPFRTPDNAVISGSIPFRIHHKGYSLTEAALGKRDMPKSPFGIGSESAVGRYCPHYRHSFIAGTSKRVLPHDFQCIRER